MTRRSGPVALEPVALGHDRTSGTIPGMTRVVHLHIGAPKTGATYLRDRLAVNTQTLAEHGVTVPTRGRVGAEVFHFRAALDLLGEDWGGEPGHAVGGWGALLKAIEAGSEHAVVSHDILAAAAPEKIAKALNDLSAYEVHIVYTARDLGRQLPAAWQESVRHGRPWSFEQFLAKMDRGESWFARALDLPSSLNRWSARLPPEQVHVVTVPHDRGGDVLWQRFAQACDFDPAWALLDSERTARSLGAVETHLLRQLNQRLDPAVRRTETYNSIVAALHQSAAQGQRKTLPVALPPRSYDVVEEHAQRCIDWLVGSGVEVIGDVEDLRPRRADAEEWNDPDTARPRMQLAAAMDALAALTRENAQRAERSHLSEAVRRRARGWGRG